MPYVINKVKGTIVNHPTVGRIEGLKAYKISDDEALMLKNIINLLIFDEIKERE